MVNSQSSAFNPNFIPLTGTDLASGKRDVDLWKMASKGKIPDFMTLLHPPSTVPPFGDELYQYAAKPAPVDATIRSTIKAVLAIYLIIIYMFGLVIVPSTNHRCFSCGRQCRLLLF